MAVVNCAMCELRFATRAERDWHLRNEHRHAHTHHPVEAAETGEPARARPTPVPHPELEEGQR